MRSPPASADVGSPLLPFGALLGGALAMAVSPIFVRLAEVGPLTSAFWRVFLALPLLWGWMRASERKAAPAAPARAFAPATLLAAACFTGDLLCWHLSLVRTTVANATFFATMAPLWVVVFGFLLFRHRVSRAVLLGLALCVLGGLGLVAQSLKAGAGHLVGDSFGIATGVFFGLYFMAVSAARREAGAARVTFELSVLTAAALFIAALATERAFLPPTPAGWAALLGMAWISHAGGQGLLSVALGRLPTVFSSLVIFLEAIVAALLAWLILGEAVTPLQGFGASAIVAGIWIARPR